MVFKGAGFVDAPLVYHPLCNTSKYKVIRGERVIRCFGCARGGEHQGTALRSVVGVGVITRAYEYDNQRAHSVANECSSCSAEYWPPTRHLYAMSQLSNMVVFDTHF